MSGFVGTWRVTDGDLAKRSVERNHKLQPGWGALRLDPKTAPAMMASVAVSGKVTCPDCGTASPFTVRVDWELAPDQALAKCRCGSGIGVIGFAENGVLYLIGRPEAPGAAAKTISLSVTGIRE